MNATTDARYFNCATSERYHFTVHLYFTAEALDGEMPVEIVCWYGAGDGPGTVVISKRADSLTATNPRRVTRRGFKRLKGIGYITHIP